MFSLTSKSDGGRKKSKERFELPENSNYKLLELSLNSSFRSVSLSERFKGWEGISLVGW